MVFPVDWFPTPDACRPPVDLPKVGRPCDSSSTWPSEDPALAAALGDYCLNHLQQMLESQAEKTAAIVIEPVMQGAAGMICQPPGFMRRVADLAKRYGVLLIADEVAVGFGRTGAMFACEHERVSPDILCLAKGLTGGYLPLAVTITTDAIYDAFTGEPNEKKTLYHGHTYTGNPLACAAALAGLDLFEAPTHGSANLLAHTRQMAGLIHEKLKPLRHCPHVADIRQRGIMVGIELGENRSWPHDQSASAADDGAPEPFDFSKPRGHVICEGLRDQGVIIRPLGNVLVLMPIPATPLEVIGELIDRVVEAIQKHHD
jgi:adenosylmethionine-8-amino-7-oxononanoate aminotransferase